MNSDDFNPRDLRAVLDRQIAVSRPDVDVVMEVARRGTRQPKESLASVEDWAKGVADSANSVDVLSAFLMGWRIGGMVPPLSLVQTLVDRIQRIGLGRIGPNAANTAVLALVPALKEIGGQVEKDVRRTLHEAVQHRGALGLQTGAKEALHELFGDAPETGL